MLMPLAWIMYAWTPLQRKAGKGSVNSLERIFEIDNYKKHHPLDLFVAML